MALWRSDGRWAGFVPLADACALAPDAQAARLWAGGTGTAQTLIGATGTDAALRVQGLRLDNHWALLGA